MRVTITGSAGQLGTALQEQLKSTHEIQALDLPAFDLTDDRIISTITGFSPDLVIHCAAYTDVDGCERNPAAAYAVNEGATRNVALASREIDAPMVYISTNYVFDGLKNEAYDEDDPVAPLSVYGKSKLAGEEQVRALVNKSYIVRTAWLYGAGRNFVKTILTLAESRDTLRVVADQFGSPTYAVDLAAAILQLIPSSAYGLYHFTNSGRCSWYDWACAVLRIAGKPRTEVIPIPGDEYQRAATPPRYGVIGNNRGMKLGITLRPWEEALQDFLSTEAAE